MSTSKIHGTDATCVYYWDGGSEAGRWRRAAPNRYTSEAEREIGAFKRSIERQGYVAVIGSDVVGPPDGPPRKRSLIRSADLERCLTAKNEVTS